MSMESSETGDLDGLKSDQLVSSQLDGGQLAQILTDCQRSSDSMMAKPFSYEGDSKNLEEHSSGGNCLMQEHSTEGMDQNYSKKVHTQTQLQSVSGAESAYDVDHGSVRQIALQVPDLGSEQEVLSSSCNIAQIPMDDPNCSELEWESTDLPDLSDLSHFDSILHHNHYQSQDSQQGGTTPQSNDCFVIGNFTSTIKSDLPNKVVTDTVKTIADYSLTPTFSNALNSMPGFNQLVKEPDFHPEQGARFVSDFTEILSPETSLSQSLDNIRLHSLKSSDTDAVVVSQTETFCSPTEDLGPYVISAESDLTEILKDICQYEEGIREVDDVDFGQEELATEFPESGGINIPTVVDEWEVSDEEEGHKKATRSKRVRKKKGESPHSINFTKPATPKTGASKQKPRSIWTFLLDSLYDKRCNPAYIKWTDEEQGQFKIVNGPELAERWSDGRNRTKLSYPHFARAMRHYYKKNYLMRVAGKKLMYEFTESSGWRDYKPTSD